MVLERINEPLRHNYNFENRLMWSDKMFVTGDIPNSVIVNYDLYIRCRLQVITGLKGIL